MKRKRISIKRRSLILSFMIITTLLMRCGEKQICDYCGESKFCTEYDLAGISRLICEDCLSNPLAGISSNSIMAEYGVELPPVAEEIPEETDEADLVAEEGLDLSTITAETVSENQTVQATITKADILSTLNAYYEPAGMALNVYKNNDNIYGLYSDDNYQNIQFIFTPVAEDAPPTLSVQFYKNASPTGYTAACIYGALAYVESTDYQGLGYTIYNNTVSYGSYVTNGARFYYTKFSETDIANGAPGASFDMSR